MKSRRNTAGHGKSPWLLTLILTAGALFGAPPAGTAPECRTLRFVQDDAQDKMVSRIFTLKYLQANDIAPFVTGMVKRYNMNSTVSCFSYVYGNVQQQILTVTTPAKMMACVAEFLERADRKITVNGNTPTEEVFYPTYPANGSEIQYPYTVPQGKVFILNDFREDTNDSRSFGAVDTGDLKGTLLLTMRRRGF